MSTTSSAPARLWLEIAHHPAFRAGGWAWVRADGADICGQAGGERRIYGERAALLGLLAALKSLPAGRAAALSTSSRLLAAVPARLAASATGQDPPTENLDLWAQAAKALAAGEVRILQAERAPATPGAFAAAWAELAQGRAKDRGPFAAPIPRSNLAKAGV